MKNIKIILLAFGIILIITGSVIGKYEKEGAAMPVKGYLVTGFGAIFIFISVSMFIWKSIK